MRKSEFNSMCDRELRRLSGRYRFNDPILYGAAREAERRAARMMADLKGSTATVDPSALTGTEKFLASVGGVDNVITARQIGAYIGDALGNQQFSGQSPAAGATTYLTGSSITIPTGERVKNTTWFRWTGGVTKTAAGTVASSFLVKWGTAGTTADATIGTFTLPTGSAVADSGDFDVFVGFRSVGAGTAAVVYGFLRFRHKLATTGLLTTASIDYFTFTSAGFNSDVNLSIIGLAFTAGTSQAWTFPFLSVEGKNI